MKFFFLFFLFFSVISNAQPVKIGSDKDLKDKLVLIKSKLPDIKGGLTVERYGERVPNFKMGKSVLSYLESNTSETFTIRFSAPIYYSGTYEEFKSYYDKCVQMVYELIKSTHDTTTNEDGSKITTYFREKEILKTDRPLVIVIKLVGPADSPWLTISFISQKPKKD